MNQEQGNETIAELPAIGDPGAAELIPEPVAMNEGDGETPVSAPVVSPAEVPLDGGLFSERGAISTAFPVGSALADASLDHAAVFENASAKADPTEIAAGQNSELTTEPAQPNVRQKLIEQFERWLDRMSEGEPPPEGIPQEILVEAGQTPVQDNGLTSDLYSLFSALTTLSGEVRLQGRTFKGLTDALAPIAQLPGRLDRIETAQGIVVQDLARRAAIESQAAGPKSKEILAVMFDLYDRLERGMRTFEASVESLRGQTFTGWRQRMLGGAEQARALLDSAEAIEEGYRLTLSRLDAAFTQWGVERIAAEGEMFDPELMAVIEVQPSPGVADGTVLDVYKSGYLLHGQVLMTAQVKVCRNA